MAKRTPFHTLAGLSSDAVLVFGGGDRLVVANPAAETLLGCREERVRGAAAGTLFPLLVPPFPPRAETLLRRPDGRSLPVRLEASPIRLEGGPAVLCLVRDPAGDAARREIAEARRLLRTLTTGLPGLAYRCRADAAWTMEYCSDGALQLTGYRPDELVGNAGVAYADLIHPEDRARVAARVAEATAAGRAFRLEYRIIARDGTEKWVWEQGRPVREEDDPAGGGYTALEGFITDATERVRAERGMRRAEELRRRGEQLAYVGELAARLNHEIKNPLATVRAGLEVLERELHLGEEHAPVLATVVQEIRNVNRLVSSLLSVSRPETLQPARHDLAALVREAVDPFRPVARRRGMALEVVLPEGPLPARVDERSFHRFLGNLLMNAIDVLASRGRIVVTARRVEAAEAARQFPAGPEEVVAVSVADDGPGIPPEVFPKLFDPFFTTKSSGTGLGLPVARDIVEFHGGTLVVRSTPGQGACFEAYLPVEGPPAAPAAGERRP